MHIPDGFLSAPVSLVSAVLSVAAVGVAAGRTKHRLGTRTVPMLGVTAAFVFAAQMLNFPVAGGTSGHLVGGVLASVLLGPSAAVVAMTAVLVLQCLVYGDGGLLALGVNVLNMAVVHPLVGFAVYRALGPRSAQRARFGQVRCIAAAAFAAWVATVVAAAMCAGEIALSAVVAPAVVFTAMVGVHAVIGVGESLITALVLATVLRLRPELLADGRGQPGRAAASSLVLALVASLALALFVSPFACAWPDGLERVVERLGLKPAHAQLHLHALIGGYSVPGLSGSALSVSVAAIAGTLLAFVLCCALGFWLAPRSAPRAPASRP